jgi:predicted secreted protein
LGRKGRRFKSGRPDYVVDRLIKDARSGRIKRVLLAAAVALLALNVWTGSPLLAVWLGSRVQGAESQPSMAAFAVVIIALVAFSLILYQLLRLTMRAYQEATGTTPSVRTHAPWLRSMRDERPGSPSTRRGISGAERIVVVVVVIAAVAFEVWFFFLSGSPIGGGGR